MASDARESAWLENDQEGLVEYDGIVTRRLQVLPDGSVVRSDRKEDTSGTVGTRVGLGRALRESFLPDGVSKDYYAYTRWRVIQRLVSSTVHVFGTQALLLALGIKAEKLGAGSMKWEARPSRLPLSPTTRYTGALPAG